VNPVSDPMAPIEVDARGLSCPLPVIRLARAAKDAPPGTWVVVLASDPAARYDIPAWCRMRHHELREMTEVPDRPTFPEMAEVSSSSGPGDPPAPGTPQAYLRFLVLIRPQRSKAGGTGSDSEPSSRQM
jgi:tRNA 2-thiouridine synthesizing protein A